MNRKLILELLNGLIFALTIIGINAADLLSISIDRPTKLAISIVLVVFYVIVAFKKGYERLHSFREDSKRFSRFFEKWYSMSGTLSVFCTDLEWLDRPQHAQVVEALAKKRDRLYLYLRKFDDNVTKTLVANGAKLRIIKESVRTQHRLSILDTEGIQRIIVRNKDTSQDSSDDIVFIETDSYRDPYLISLANDLLDDCYEINPAT